MKMKLTLTSILIAVAMASPASAAMTDETHGDGVAAYSLQNYELAREIWTRLAEEGDGQSIFRLADLYARGLGGPKDAAMAAKYYCMSSEANDARGAYLCGKGKKESGQGGIAEYKKAAGLGHRKAQFYLANFYVKGDGVDKDYHEAYRLYKAVNESNADDQLGRLAAKMITALDPVVNK